MKTHPLLIKLIKRKESSIIKAVLFCLNSSRLSSLTKRLNDLASSGHHPCSALAKSQQLRNREIRFCQVASLPMITRSMKLTACMGKAYSTWALGKDTTALQEKY